MWKRFVPGSCESARTVMVTGLREFTDRDFPCLCSTVTTSISSSSETTDIKKHLAPQPLSINWVVLVCIL